MASLLQDKNASIKRLKRLIFGPSSDKRALTGSSTEEEAAARGEDSEHQPGFDSSPEPPNHHQIGSRNDRGMGEWRRPLTLARKS
jgi:hypothetical protein